MKNIIGGQDISTIFEIFPGAYVKSYAQAAGELKVTVAIPETAIEKQMDALKYFHKVHPGIQVVVEVAQASSGESADA